MLAEYERTCVRVRELRVHDTRYVSASGIRAAKVERVVRIGTVFPIEAALVGWAGWPTVCFAGRSSRYLSYPRV